MDFALHVFEVEQVWMLCRLARFCSVEDIHFPTRFESDTSSLVLIYTNYCERKCNNVQVFTLRAGFTSPPPLPVRRNKPPAILSREGLSTCFPRRPLLMSNCACLHPINRRCRRLVPRGKDSTRISTSMYKYID